MAAACPRSARPRPPLLQSGSTLAKKIIGNTFAD